MTLKSFILANAALIIFYLLYLWLLHTQTHFKWSRAYLLSSLLSVVAILFVHFPQNYNPTGFTEFVLPEISFTAAPVVTQWDLWSVITTVYFAVAVILLLIKGSRVLLVYTKIKRLPAHPHYPSTFTSPGAYSFSFLQKIYLQSNLNTEEESAVFIHENLHRQQWHYIDLIILELLSCFFWINPVIRLYRQSLSEIHEFLADLAVLKKVECNGYQKQLVAASLGISSQTLMNPFYKSNTLKQRIMMMNKKHSPSTTKFRYLLLLPFFATFLILAGFNTVPDNLTPTPPQSATLVKQDTIQPDFPGGVEALMAYLGREIHYPEEAKRDSVEGTVYVRFTIQKNGKAENISVVRPVHPTLDKESLRVMKNMPAWKPGSVDGRPIPIELVLPIKFSMKK